MTTTEAFSKEQSVAYQKFRQGENLFVSGPAGSGKSYLISSIRDHCTNTQKRVAVCALTGCASVLLGKASTIHSFSGIGIMRGTNGDVVKKAMKNPFAMSNWRETQVLIVDEVSMMSEKMLQILDTIGQQARKNKRAFGGMQVIFTGDFYQLPPIGDNEDPATGNFCFMYNRWNTIFPMENHILLKTLYRQTDEVYKQILNEMRLGKVSDEHFEILKGRLGLINDETKVITKLFPVKRRVDMVNKQEYDKLDALSNAYEFRSFSSAKRYIDSGEPFDEITQELCDNMTSNDIVTETERFMGILPTTNTVHIKIGAVVMLTMNLDVESGLCNGAQGKVVDILKNKMIQIPSANASMSTSFIVVRFNNGLTQDIKPFVWQSEVYPRMIIAQFPLIHAWALTIHKIQGATLSCAEIDAGMGIFEHGQSYVALSRVKSLDGLYLTGFHRHRVTANPIVHSFYKYIPDLEIPDDIDVDVPTIHNTARIRKIGSTGSLTSRSITPNESPRPANQQFFCNEEKDANDVPITHVPITHVPIAVATPVSRPNANVPIAEAFYVNDEESETRHITF